MKMVSCVRCGNPVSIKSKTKSYQHFCPECKIKRKKERQKVVITNCCVCGKEIECKGSKPWKTCLFKAKHGIATCSEECTKERIKEGHKKSGKLLSQYSKDHALEISERMKKRNPMDVLKIVEKGKSTKRANGTLHIWPGERGGNGKYTKAQMIIAIALGWPMEVAVPCASHLPVKQKKNYCKENGFPTCYKVDVGNPILKIAIEVDGKKHCLKKQKKLDIKKEDKLIGLGWKVLRFTNEEVMENLEKCIKTIMFTI